MTDSETLLTMNSKNMSALECTPGLVLALAPFRAGISAARAANHHPQFLAKTRPIDWVRRAEDVRLDIAIAHDAKSK